MDTLFLRDEKRDLTYPIINTGRHVDSASVTQIVMLTYMNVQRECHNTLICVIVYCHKNNKGVQTHQHIFMTAVAHIQMQLMFSELCE